MHALARSHAIHHLASIPFVGYSSKAQLVASIIITVPFIIYTIQAETATPTEIVGLKDYTEATQRGRVKCRNCSLCGGWQHAITRPMFCTGWQGHTPMRQVPQQEHVGGTTVSFDFNQRICCTSLGSNLKSVELISRSSDLIRHSCISNVFSGSPFKKSF